MLWMRGGSYPEHKAGKPDPKAISRGEDEIELEVPGQPGVKAAVKLRMTLLPKEWRLTAGAGGSPLAKERKITSLRDQIRDKIWRAIESLRRQIQQDIQEKHSDEIKKAGFFAGAEKFPAGR